MESTPTSRWRELAHGQLRDQYPDFELVCMDNEVKRTLTLLQVRYPSEGNLDFLIGRLRHFGYGRDDIKRIVHKHNRWKTYEANDFAVLVDGHNCTTMGPWPRIDADDLPDLEAVADKSFRLAVGGPEALPSITIEARRQHLDSFMEIAGRLP